MPLLRCPIQHAVFKILINSITNGLSLFLTHKTLRVCGRIRNYKSNNNLKVKNNSSCKKEKATFSCYIVKEPL